MPLLHGLVFDLDGTLIDSAPDLRRALNATLGDYGRPPLDLSTVAGLTGDGLMPLLKRAFAASGAAMDDGAADNVFQTFIDHYRRLDADPAQIYPHVRAFLEQCRQYDLRMGLCTNKQAAETHRLLEQIGLAHFFGFVAGGDTYAVHKPHPDHLRGVLKELQLDAANAVMVGDSRNDVMAAIGAGIPCIGVTHGYGGSLAGLGANITVDGFDQIPQALTRLGFTHPLQE